MWEAQHSKTPAVLELLIKAKGDVDAKDEVRGLGEGRYVYVCVCMCVCKCMCNGMCTDFWQAKLLKEMTPPRSK